MELVICDNNYVVVDHKGALYCFSYKKLVAVHYYINDVVLIDEKWGGYSRTTAHHVNRFLGVDSRTFKKNTKLGLYTYANLQEYDFDKLI